ncbi:MAG: DUF948 domain-containing protein [Gemmatimonadota bacterium]
MASWVGPTVAISVALIALSFVIIAALLIVAIREARDTSETVARELTQLRHDLTPTLATINRLGDSGSELIGRLSDEVHEVIKTSQDVRRGVKKAVRQAEGRLADLDALLEVATDEAEAALMDASAAIQSVRTSAGLLSHIGRFLVPQGEADEEYEDDEDVEEEEDDLEDLDEDLEEDTDDDADDEDVA